MAVVSGLLQVLPFPIAAPVPLWRTALCWVVLFPLLAALVSKDSHGKPLNIGQGAALGYASGFIWYLGNCYWIYATMHLYGGLSKPVSAGILILFCLYLGLYHALFGALVAGFQHARIRNRVLGAQGALLLSPFAWVAVELARARLTGLPWDLLGIAQVDNPLLTRLAPITGAYGISFVIAAVNALWLVRIKVRDRRYTRPALTAAGVVIVVLYVLFLRRIQHPIHEGTDAVATLVQENLEVGAANTGPPLSEKQMLVAFSDLSLHPRLNYCLGIPELASTKCIQIIPVDQEGVESARAPARTDLIVWPESPAPFDHNVPQFRDALSQLAREANAPMIVGDFGMDADADLKHTYLHNSADFIEPDGSFAGRYNKMHLVPFGEYVPFKKLFFFAGDLLADAGDISPGTYRSVFKTGGEVYGTFICYESIFGDEMREYPGLGAGVLVNIANDGWYGNTAATWEHLNMVRMRAIENHRWILRATNTGVTVSIDPYGRVVMSAPRHIRTSIRVGFDFEHDVTFYAAHGDLFAYLCAVVTAGGIGCGLMRRA